MLPERGEGVVVAGVLAEGEVGWNAGGDACLLEEGDGGEEDVPEASVEGRRLEEVLSPSGFGELG